MFDIVFALTVLIAVLPVVILLIVLFKLESPGPAFFVQQRIGRNGVRFPCLKLRTMKVDAAARLEALLATSPEARAEWEANHKLKNDPRTTAFGALIRKYSLDELPQLINILVGHMSVVGPRPIVDDEIWRYGHHFAEYCSVRPGLTGLWQVSGRSNTTYEQRVALDCLYVRDRSLALDVKIIFRSIPAVLNSRGAY
ncbi:MAG: sugar transferase [Sphingomonadales bacterium 32-68-7]|nr:MAG: sugar transferase [Sphingomonadales bacterium 12-68-11]OYX09214.1 MAG: sugar transferase [Sphingomonadales bacterium 32-68-7]